MEKTETNIDPRTGIEVAATKRDIARDLLTVHLTDAELAAAGGDPVAAVQGREDVILYTLLLDMVSDIDNLTAAVAELTERVTKVEPKPKSA